MVNKSCIVIGVLTVTVLAVTLGIIFWPVNLQKVFMNRCETNLEKFGLASQNDCEKIWDSFTQSFVGKDPCDVPPEAYDFLIHTVSQEPACNRTMFWSKTKEIVHEFAKKCSYVTVEDTLLGFLLDGLTWCGKKESKETFTTECPSWSDCVNNPVRSFWNRASAAFAAFACGDVSVMLDGSIDMPYDPDSIFASVEVKKFTSKMKSLTVLLVTEGDTQTCESYLSLKNLKNDLDPKLKYQCTVVPQSQLQTCIVH